MHGANLAFRRLRAFQRQHGRLPLTTAVANADGPLPPGSAWTRKRLASALALACIGVATAAFAIFYTNSKSVNPPITTPPLLATAATEPAAPPPSTAGRATTAKPAATRPTTVKPTATRPAAARQLKLGDSRENVVALLGAPPQRKHDRWEYGPSHVRFARGRVVDWYSSPRQPLPVPAQRPAATQ